MIYAFGRTRICLAAASVLTVGLFSEVAPVRADWRAFVAQGHQPDLITRDLQRYAPLLSQLPPQGTVGYLPPDDWPTADAVRRFYLAEYALTPRVVVIGTTLPSVQFVIVGPEASLEGGGTPGRSSPDRRLTDFALYRYFDNGVRVFRRLQ